MEQKNDALLPCPFCKGEFELIVVQEAQRKAVTCLGCGACAGVNVWNTRPAPHAKHDGEEALK